MICAENVSSHRSLIFNYGAIIWGWIFMEPKFPIFFSFPGKVLQSSCCSMKQWKHESGTHAHSKRGAVWVQVTTGADYMGWAGGIA